MSLQMIHDTNHKKSVLFSVMQVSDLVRGQCAVCVHDPHGAAISASGVQLAGVLDELFYTDEPLGQYWEASVAAHMISVWAPTAVKVELLHWQDLRGGKYSVHDMERNDKGVWRFQRPAEWNNT